MKKLAITVLVLVLSVLVSNVAMAERGDIGGVGVKSMRTMLKPW
ncbi:MAG TPA: hypothetical protein VD973_05650 [Symbiobacteriaceae bacterium]|jgi:hypothetical protein|nr:hypothetical protein [Symbiobacteriaceae bacterium]